MTASFQRPTQVIKNSLDFKIKVSNINVPQDHIMAYVDVLSLFPVQKELGYKSIKKRWNDMKLHTKLPLEEFLEDLDICQIGSHPL